VFIFKKDFKQKKDPQINEGLFGGEYRARHLLISSFDRVSDYIIIS